MWVVLTVLPTALTAIPASMLSKAVYLDENTVRFMQLSLLAVQLFSLIMMIRYKREIF